MTDFNLGAGTAEQRTDTALCKTCGRWVTFGECGRTFEQLADYVAATAAYPCSFPEGTDSRIAKGSMVVVSQEVKYSEPHIIVEKLEVPFEPGESLRDYQQRTGKPT